jgi:hypothetical protein
MLERKFLDWALLHFSAASCGTIRLAVDRNKPMLTAQQ